MVRESDKALIAKREQSLMRVSLERRQIGERLVLLDSAQLRVRPVGPTRNLAAIAGGLAGLALSGDGASVPFRSPRESRAGHCSGRDIAAIPDVSSKKAR